jgi:hypothetical protein
MLTAQVARSGGEAGVDGGPMIAAGQLAEALETQLASAPPAGAAARIGVSFPAQDGRFCRTFETPELAGLGCRGGKGWEIVTMARTGTGGERDGEFRQAGSGAALVMQMSQEMMAGDPLDAGAERRARDSGWRVDPR